MQHVLNLSCTKIPSRVIYQSLQSLLAIPQGTALSDEKTVYRRCLNLLTTDLGLSIFASSTQKIIQQSSSDVVQWEMKSSKNAILYTFCSTFDYFDDVYNVLKSTESEESRSSDFDETFSALSGYSTSLFSRANSKRPYTEDSSDEILESEIFRSLTSIASYIPGVFELAR